LGQKKEQIQQDIMQKQEQIEKLEEYIRQREEKIVEITNLIPNLERDRKKIQKDIEQRKTQISTITAGDRTYLVRAELQV